MPYIQGGGAQKDSGLPSIEDVFHSPSVFINNVEAALWDQPQDSAAATALASAPDVAFTMEEAEGDGVGTDSNSVDQAIASTSQQISIAQSDGTISSTSTVLTPVTTTGTIDTSTGTNIQAVQASGDFSQYNQDNIPYDTLMLTPKTSLATFTTKAALWGNQPKPPGPNTPYGSGGTKGDNKYIKAQKGLTVPQILSNLANLASNVWEPFKARYPNALITNTFRQDAPGGSANQQQHGTGQAMDIIIPGANAQKYYEAACWVRDNLPFDQLLQEKAGGTIWIHVSLYSGTGIKVPTMNKVANMVVSPSQSFTRGLQPYA
jgi:hypothetical protein